MSGGTQSGTAKPARRWSATRCPSGSTSAGTRTPSTSMKCDGLITP